MTKDPYVFLKFQAQNRNFHIRLKRDLVTFSDNLEVNAVLNIFVTNIVIRGIWSMKLHRNSVIENNSLTFCLYRSETKQIHSPQGEINMDTSHIYQGEVLGEPNSHVFGSIIDGIFEGKIITDEHAYYVENAKHYFPNHTHLDHGFHSVIYNERDVLDDPYAHRRKREYGGICQCI